MHFGLGERLTGDVVPSWPMQMPQPEGGESVMKVAVRVALQSFTALVISLQTHCNGDAIPLAYLPDEGCLASP